MTATDTTADAIAAAARGEGTALFAIVLSRQAGAGLHGAGGVGALARAFGTTFWVAAGLIAVAVVPALLLPRPRRAAEAGARATASRHGPREPLERRR